MWIEYDGQAINLDLMNSFLKAQGNDYPYTESFQIEFHCEDDYTVFEFKNEKDRDDMYEYIIKLMEDKNNLLRYSIKELKENLL